MATIGNLGKLITFEVSSDKVLTFRDMAQTVKGRWATHARIGRKPKSEFLGADQRALNLSIFLSATHGVKPRETIKNIEAAVEKGNSYTLVIGGEQVGANKWVITDMSETWGDIIQDGKLVSAHLTLNLAEYV